MLVNASLLARFQRPVVVLLILISTTIAHAADEVMRAPDYTIAQIRLTPANSSTSITFSVKLAVTPSQHAYGLMFSPPLPAKSGMLFLFEDMKPRTFWMKNTPIALDMLFFDDSGRLVTLISNAKPNTSRQASNCCSSGPQHVRRPKQSASEVHQSVETPHDAPTTPPTVATISPKGPYHVQPRTHP